MNSFLIVTIIITLLGQVQGNQQKDVPLPDLKDIVVAGPYCGIYSFIVCLDAFDKRISIKDLLKPEYVGSNRGSSNEELIIAAEKYGLHGKCYVNITWQVLKEIKEPAILHFRGGLDSEFNHWVAFLGCEGNHVRIVDYPHELATLTMAELLAHWDGTAILFSEKPITNDLVWMSRLDFLITALILFGAAFLYKIYFYNKNNEPEFAPTRKEFFRRAFVQTATLLTVCVFAAITYHSLSPIGFFRNPSGVAEVIRRYYAVDVPEVSVTEMQNIVAKKSAIIYDCRYHRDFNQGAVPGAINMPVNSNLAERRQILQGIDPSQKIVLYCQSSGCGFVDSVASFLKFNGYKNLSIYRGGYREWSSVQTP